MGVMLSVLNLSFWRRHVGQAQGQSQVHVHAQDRRFWSAPRLSTGRTQTRTRARARTSTRVHGAFSTTAEHLDSDSRRSCCTCKQAHKECKGTTSVGWQSTTMTDSDTVHFVSVSILVTRRQTTGLVYLYAVADVVVLNCASACFNPF